MASSAFQLHKNLTELMKAHDLSVSELARRTGIPRQSVSDWIAGRSPRKLADLKVVADLFHTDLDQLCFAKWENLESAIRNQARELSGLTEIAQVNHPAMIVNMRGRIIDGSLWMRNNIPNFADPLIQNSYGTLIHIHDRIDLRKEILRGLEEGRNDFQAQFRLLGANHQLIPTRWYFHRCCECETVFCLGRDLGPLIGVEIEAPELFQLSKIADRVMNLVSAIQSIQGVSLRRPIDELSGSLGSIWVKTYYAQLSSLVTILLDTLIAQMDSCREFQISTTARGRTAVLRMKCRTSNLSKWQAPQSLAMQTWLKVTGGQVISLQEEGRVGFELLLPLA